MKSIPNFNTSLSTSPDVKTTGATTTAIKNCDGISLLKNVGYSNSIALGGDPQSFSDTELLLEETVTNAVVAGIPKLTEPSTVSRRQHMLNQTSYHGFQGLVTQTVLEVLLKEYSSQLNDSLVHPSLQHHSSPTSAASSSSSTTTSSTRGAIATGLELKSSIDHDQSHSLLIQETSNKSHLLSFISSSPVPPLLSNQEFDFKVSIFLL